MQKFFFVRLVRVGIEKEHGLSPDSKMVVLHDFTPCVDDELEVKRGQIVNILYRENDWVYIIGQDTKQEGFIPYSYCAPYNSQLADLAIKKKLPRNGNNNNNNNNGVVNMTSDQNLLNSDYSEMDLNHQTNENNLKQSQGSLNYCEPDYLPFFKDPSGRYIVLYTFIARDENDVSVERGEFVTVLNKEDHDWYWIVRTDGQEGFVPSAFVYPAENILQNQDLLAMTAPATSTNNINNCNTNSNNPVNASNGNFLNYNNAATSHQAPHHQILQQPHQQVQQPLPHIQQQQHFNPTTSSNALSLPTINNGTFQQCQALQQQQQHQLHQQPAVMPSQNELGSEDDLRYHGTELVMLYDYKAQAPDDLSARRGEIIYADLNNQTVEGWLWAYAPKASKKCGKYGFIPKSYTHTYNRQNTSV